MAVPYSRPYVHPLSKPSSAPVATGGRQQPASARGPKAPKPQAAPRTVRVKAHTRTVAPRAPKAPANPDQALIDAAVRSRFAPQEQALNQQLQQNTRYTSGLPAWYSNALDEIRGLQSAGQTQTQQTLGQLGQYNSQAVLANPNDQQAANARNNLNAEFAAQQGQVGQANSGALDRLMAAFLLQQGNTQNQANQQRSQLLGQQGQLGQQKADFGLQYGAQLRSAEQTAQTNQDRLNLQRAVAEATGLYHQGQLQNQQAALRSLNQNRQAGQRVARSNVRTNRQRVASTVAKQNADFSTTHPGYTVAEWNALSSEQKQTTLNSWKASGTGPYSSKKGVSTAGPRSSFTPTQVRKARADYRKAQALLDPVVVKRDPSGAIKALTSPKAKNKPIGGVDPLMAEAIVQEIAFGGADSPTARRFAKSFGFQVRSRNVPINVAGVR